VNDIQAKALCVVRDRGEILVREYHDETADERFCRPLGGTIEFGEYSDDAVKREFCEELDAELADVRRLGLLENVFEFRGEPGHEFVVVYDGRFADETLYDRDAIPAYEPEFDTEFEAVWKPLSAFDGEETLYPAGLLDLLWGNRPRI
jgi:ADP-ribose pyrophosphatase YjhB (NUDIX family)